MSTRGTVGFRKNDEDKLVYNHYDSYPSGLGKATLDFIRACTSFDLLQNLNLNERNERGYIGTLACLSKIHDRLQPVKSSDKVPESWLEYYAGYIIPAKLEKPIKAWDNLIQLISNVRSGVLSSWLDPESICEPEQDALLNIMDAISPWPKQMPVIHFVENNDFIKESLFCEYGYIINLDSNLLEFWIGHQDKPSYGNRYGTCNTPLGYAGAMPYWPCLKIAEYQLSICAIDPTGVLARMKKDVRDYKPVSEEDEL